MRLTGWLLWLPATMVAGLFACTTAAPGPAATATAPRVVTPTSLPVSASTQPPQPTGTLSPTVAPATKPTSAPTAAATPAPPTAIPSPTPRPTAAPTLAPAKPAAAAGVEFVSVVGGRPGGRASVTVQTVPKASCSISYRTPAGTRSTAQGLVPTTADANGRASWSWVIGSNTRPGTGTVTVSCGGVSASASIRIG